MHYASRSQQQLVIPTIAPAGQEGNDAGIVVGDGDIDDDDNNNSSVASSTASASSAAPAAIVDVENVVVAADG